MTGPETPGPEAAAALSWAIKATEEYLQARYPGPSAWPPKRTRQLDVLRTLLRQLRHGEEPDDAARHPMHVSGCRLAP